MSRNGVNLLVQHLSHASGRASQWSARRQFPASAPPSSRSFRSIPDLRTTHEQKQEDTFGRREELNPRRSEVAKTGNDDEMAQQKTSYDPSTTRPEREFRASESESKHCGKVENPLNVSPANRDVSAPRDPQEGGPARNAGEPRPSRKGQTKKHHKVHPGGEPGR